MPSPRGSLLCTDVEHMVKAGKSIHVPRSDELNKLKRYLNRNKRKIGVSGTAIAIGAIVAGPAALGVVAVAVGGKAVAFALTRAWRAARRYSAKSSIEDFALEGGSLTKRDDAGLLAVNSEYREILQDVRYLCSHGGLTDTFNAFSELEKDYDQCAKWNTAIATGQISSCKDAIAMWEVISRVHYRFEAIKPVFALIDDMVMYTVLELSRMEREFDIRFKGWWYGFKTAARGRDLLPILNEAANQDEVLHTRGVSFGRIADCTDWLRVALPPVARTELKLIGPRGNPASAADVPVALASAVTKDLAQSQTVGTGVEFGKQVVTSSLSGDKILAAAVPLNAGGVVGVGETVLATFAEKANDYVNVQKYETKKTAVLYFFYKRDQTKRERIGTLRKLAKDTLEAYIEKFDHWMRSHETWVKSRDGADKMAVLLLRRQKHALQVAELSKFVYEFHETLVQEANLMSQSVETMRARAKEVIEHWVDNHPPSHVCEGHCYSSLLHGLRGIGLGIDPATFQRWESKWDGAPVWRVTDATPALKTTVMALEARKAI